MFRYTKRVKFQMKKFKQKKRSSEWKREGSIQEVCLITLNRPDLEFKLANVGYLCCSGYEGHSMWDVFSTGLA